MSNTGFKIIAGFQRPDKALVESFAGIPVANIGDCVNRSFCLSARIRPRNAAPLLGTAFTVKTRPGDNLLLHKAIDLAQPGDVIVVDAEGDLSNAITGEMMITWMQRRGIHGLIIDGAVRDAGAIRNMTIPVYAAGVTPRGPYKDGPGEINVPISCGGVSIRPGDIVVGDSDGVIVIRPEEAPDILAKAQAIMEKEAGMASAIQSGTWDRSWVDKVLKEKGCEIIG